MIRFSRSTVRTILKSRSTAMRRPVYTSRTCSAAGRPCPEASAIAIPRMRSDTEMKSK